MTHHKYHQELYLINLLLIAMAFFTSCNEIIEKDITGKEMRLLAPKDSALSAIYTTTFWWEELPGATSYQLQVVEANSLFSDSLSLELDTMVSSNQFKTTLYPGNYFWSVKAFNGAYSTPRSEVRRLKIDTSTIVAQRINVLDPKSDTTYTKSNKFQLLWQPLFGADEYVVFSDTSGSETLTRTSSNTINLALPLEANYRVSVQAVSGARKSIRTNKFTIIYDKTAPDTVTRSVIGSTNPNFPTFIDTTASLRWQPLLDKSGIKNYTVRLQQTSNGTTKSYTTTSTTLPLSGKGWLLNETYSWTVIATDKATNSNEARNTKPFYFRIR